MGAGGLVVVRSEWEPDGGCGGTRQEQGPDGGRGDKIEAGARWGWGWGQMGAGARSGGLGLGWNQTGVGADGVLADGSGGQMGRGLWVGPIWYPIPLSGAPPLSGMHSLSGTPSPF